MCPQVILSRLSNFLFFLRHAPDVVRVYFGTYFLEDNYDIAFYGKSSGTIWKQIQREIGKEKTRQFQKILQPFDVTFRRYWQCASPQMQAWRNYFYSKRLLFQQVNTDLKILSGATSFSISTIPVYCISDPAHNDTTLHAWFSSSLRKEFIVVEIPSSFKPSPSNLFPVSVLAHEFFHLALRKNKTLVRSIDTIAEDNEKVLARASGDVPPRIFLEELLISSFVPEGYFGKKYFKHDIVARARRPRSLLAWRKSVAFALRITAQEYLDAHQAIDEAYVRRVLEIVRQNVK